ncbi:hypothetical protein ACFP8W_01295 [Nocardioides hankookensis]|uniref:Ig-like domain repeat protein n=1 Tax=Nocardioides hankookensis TaxID=443157 RepID=A0ABW1LH81_9ACTN
MSATDNSGFTPVLSWSVTGAQTSSGSRAGSFQVSSEGVSTVQVSAVDVEGNTAERSVRVGIDLTAPTITVDNQEGATVPLGSAVPFTYSCADGGSGINFCDGFVSGQPLPASEPGDHWINLSAVDRVGRERIRKYFYEVTDGPLDVTTPPLISGRTRVGERLHVDVAFAPTPEHIRYVWLYGEHQSSQVSDGPDWTVPAEAAGYPVRVSVEAYLRSRELTTVDSPSVGPVTTFTFPDFDTPLVQGTPQVGRRLTAVPDTTDLPGGTLVQTLWYDDQGRSLSDQSEFSVDGQTAGHRVRLLVRYVKPNYDDVELWSGWTAPVAMGVVDPKPAVRNTPHWDESQRWTLFADRGANALQVPVTIEWSWADQPDVIISTNLEFELRPEDVGHVIRTRFSYRAPGYVDAVVVIDSGPVTGLDFEARGTPAITGIARAGETLRATPGSFTPAATSTDYQWLRDGATIASATGSSYRLVGVDAGHRISVRVTSRRLGFNTVQMVSAQTAPVAPAPVAGSVKPALSTRAKVLGKGKVRLTVAVSRQGASGKVAVAGKIVVKAGRKVVGRGVLKRGKVVVQLRKQKRGKHVYVVTYSGASGVKSTSKKVKVRVR